MTLPVPADWPTIPDGVLHTARRTALDALATVPFEAYYDVDGGYAGATFASIEPNDPMDVTAADLQALVMLSVTVGPAPTRRVLDQGPYREALLATLAATPAAVRLVDATAADLAAGWALHGACRRALADPTTKQESDPWVTAAKLAARKRPLLLPVRDRKVRFVLGLEPYRDGRLEIQTVRSLIADRDVVEAIDTAVAQARAAADRGGLECVFDEEPLRLLDVALWWHAARGNGAGRR